MYIKTLPAEILHTQLSDYTNEHIINELNQSQEISKLLKRHSIDSDIIRQKQYEIINKVVAVEEAVEQINKGIRKVYPETNGIYRFLTKNNTLQEKSILQQRVIDIIKMYINDWENVKKLTAVP